MKLRYLGEVFYEDLLENIENNIDLYTRKDRFIFDYFNDKPFYNETKILVGDFNLDFIKNGKPDDCNCAISLYQALSNLSPSQATNPYLWSYLCHAEGWEYMQKRWPIENESKSRIKSRYFISSSTSRTSIFRNGLSRLWWGCYLSISEELSDKYKLTRLLFSDQDLFVSLVERDFSMCRQVAIGILEFLYDDKEKKGELLHIDVRRELMKYINRLGGLQSLDLLSKEEVYHLCEEYVKNNS